MAHAGPAKAPAAIRHDADEPPVAHHQLAIGGGHLVAHDDGLGACALEVAGGEHRHARHLEVGGEQRARIDDCIAAERPGDDARMLVGRLDQAVAGAGMFDAVADGVDAGHGGPQPVIDENAAPRRQARRMGERRARAHAHRHHHQPAGDAPPVLQLDAFDA